MLNKIKDKINALIESNKNKDSKRTIENLVIFVILLIITIITINIILKGNGNKNAETDENKFDTKVLTLDNNNDDVDVPDLEKRLEDILSKIKGVGKVSVLITYSQGSEVVAMYNETTKQNITEENDTNGGKRVIEQKDVDKTIAYEEENGKKYPVTQKIILPIVTGAVVIAEGASNSSIKANITQAIEAATGLAPHKIQVFEFEK